MPIWEVIWTDRAISKMAEHGVTMDEAKHVLTYPAKEGESNSSGMPFAAGYTRSRRWLIVIYERIDAVTVVPVTAYEPDD